MDSSVSESRVERPAKRRRGSGVDRELGSKEPHDDRKRASTPGRAMRQEAKVNKVTQHGILLALISRLGNLGFQHSFPRTRTGAATAQELISASLRCAAGQFLSTLMGSLCDGICHGDPVGRGTPPTSRLQHLACER